jgi:hypothetical protein
MRSAGTRLLNLKQHLSSSISVRQQQRGMAQYQGMAAKMGSQKLDINTTYKMKSGYEIPVLGYGVRASPHPLFICGVVHTGDSVVFHG